MERVDPFTFSAGAKPASDTTRLDMPGPTPSHRTSIEMLKDLVRLLAREAARADFARRCTAQGGEA